MAVKSGEGKAGQGSAARPLIKELVAEALTKAQFECKCGVIFPCISHVPNTRFICLSRRRPWGQGGSSPCNNRQGSVFFCQVNRKMDHKGWNANWWTPKISIRVQCISQYSWLGWNYQKKKEENLRGTYGNTDLGFVINIWEAHFWVQSVVGLWVIC